MNKRMFAVFAALVLAMSGALCGCDADRNAKLDEEESISAGIKSGSSSKDNEKEESSASNLSLTDKIYTDYLSQQKLCTISKNFKILEPGAARDNPNGLADAVKYDFDGDKIDELVTFTFERNDQNGEDIRVDLLKVSGGELEVADSKYLTEMLEINDAEGSEAEFDIVSNSIYFRDIVSMQLVTSEYQDRLYFGFVLSNENNISESNPPREYMKSMTVFTIENDKIMPCMISGTYQKYSTRGSNADQGVLYATLLPPSIRETTTDLGECIIKEEVFADYPYAEYIRETSSEIIVEIDEAIRDKGYYTLFANVYSTIELNYCIGGGLYESATSAYSALLNEFGLDLEYNGYNEENDFECTARFVSKNQSNVKTILEIDAVRGYSEGEGTDSENNDFMGSRLTLDSDLEELLENETLFTESFADELALYEDILRYPHYYHEVWDAYAELSQTIAFGHINYCIADINKDGKYEMIIVDYDTTSTIVGQLMIIKPNLEELETFNWNASGCIELYDNGIISLDYMSNAGWECIDYYDFNNDEYWTAYNDRLDNGEFIRYIGIQGEESKLTNDAAKKKESELCSGIKIILEYNSYDLYHPEYLIELTIIEDVNDIMHTWQKAYLEELEETTEKDSRSYALLYMDNDDVPELYIDCVMWEDSGRVYTYANGDTTLLLESYASSAVDNYLEGYIEKEGTFWTYSANGDGSFQQYSLNKLENGTVTPIETLECNGDVYTIDGREVSETEYNQKYEEYTEQASEIAYLTYDEIIEQLNAAE